MDPLLTEIEPSVAQEDEEHSGGYYRLVNSHSPKIHPFKKAFFVFHQIMFHSGYGW